MEFEVISSCKELNVKRNVLKTNVQLFKYTGCGIKQNKKKTIIIFIHLAI